MQRPRDRLVFNFTEEGKPHDVCNVQRETEMSFVRALVKTFVDNIMSCQNLALCQRKGRDFDYLSSVSTTLSFGHSKLQCLSLPSISSYYLLTEESGMKRSMKPPVFTGCRGEGVGGSGKGATEI